MIEPRWTRYTAPLTSQMSSRRLFAFGLIVALLLVTTLVRAGQSLDLGKRPTAAS